MPRMAGAVVHRAGRLWGDTLESSVGDKGIRRWIQREGQVAGPPGPPKDGLRVPACKRLLSCLLAADFPSRAWESVSSWSPPGWCQPSV